MKDLFTSAYIVDVIILLMALEALALTWFHRRTGLGPSLTGVAAMMGAGLFLLLALRVALTGGAWELLAAALTGSLICHLADLNSRWPSGPTEHTKNGHAKSGQPMSGRPAPPAEELRG